MYVSHIDPPVPRPVKELRAFAKTALLKPGKSEVVRFELDREAWAFWCVERSSWRVVPGRYRVVAAASSDAKVATQVDVEVEVRKELLWM